jgi:vacuolar-type H+-ATPase subunit H
MSQSSVIKIRDAMSILSDMERELDQLDSQVTEIKRLLINAALKEADKASTSSIEEAKKVVQETLVKVHSEADREATEIIAKREEMINFLNNKIDENFEQAVKKVVLAVSGTELED